MSKQNILIIEDETAIRTLLRYALEMAGFSVDEVDNTESAQQKIDARTPDLILLDWMLPQKSGVDYIDQLKSNEKTATIPIIMLTAKTAEQNRVKGLESGADDYVTKPFSPRELVARIKAVLRRGMPHNKMQSHTFSIRELTLDTQSQRVTIAGQPIKLGPIEYRLLHFFINNAERVHSRDNLLNKVWGNEAYIDDRTVDVHIRRLRKRLSLHRHDRLIQTVHGSGYRFSEQSYD